MEWSYDPAFTDAGGKTEPAGVHGETLKITYPSFNYSALKNSNVYHVSSVAYDTKGNKSNHGDTEIRVSEADSSSVSIKDGDLTYGGENAVETVRRQAKVTDANDNPVVGVDVSFSADNGAKVAVASVKTDASGVAKTTLTNTAAGNTTVTVKAGYSEQTVGGEVCGGL